MNKKALRKELELELLKGIEETLSKQNSVAGKKINEVSRHASKTIAKKFYKTIKTLSEKKAIVSVKKIKTSPSKNPAKSAVSANTKVVKKGVTKLRSKSKK